MSVIKREKLQKIYHFAESCLFPLILLLYPFRHIFYGVEWWDTGYNYGNFRFSEHMDSMWQFATYLANKVGKLLTLLPFGNTMAGMNFYTAIPVCVMAVWGYFFFTKKIKLPAWLVFAGEFIAVSLCWCPTALLYNYLTYLFLFVGVLCLYLALTEQKNSLLVVAGVFLGMNVFVRFSNLSQMALILTVWAYAVIQKKKFSKVCRETGFCLLGYVLGIAVPFTYICARFGFTTYADAVRRLFDMTSAASDYTMYSMVLYQLRNFQQNFIWLLRLSPFVVLGILGFAVLPGKLMRLKKVGYVGCVLLVFRWIMNQNLFNMKYSTKMSMFQWAVMLLSFLMMTGVYHIFSKKTKPEFKLLCGLSMLVVVLTPLGSNNHLYSSINNLFFVAPVALWAILECGKRIPAVWSFFGEKLKLYAYPVKAMVVMILCALLVQSTGFGIVYVFCESDGGENMNTRVEGIPVLAGMYTDAERAEQIEELYGYMTEAKLTDRELILYGYIPSVAYYLDMPFAISAWPDLDSYAIETMEQNLMTVRAKITEGEKEPVVVWAADRLPLGGDFSPKVKLLLRYMEELNYRQVFRNGKFVVFAVQKDGGTP